MLARKGDKALDFGLAKATREQKVDSALTSERQALGTPDFIAPEQIVDAMSADIRSDIYSLGGTLYYLLTGRPPFVANSLYDLYQAHISQDANPLNLVRPEVPSELATIVAKMMAKDPGRWFQTPGEVAQALMPFFKKRSPGLVGSNPEVSRAGQTNAGRPVSTSTQPVTEAGREAVRAEKAAQPAAAESQWESLITFGEEKRPITPAPAIDPERRRPWKKWPIALAACLFGLIVLGGIIITIRDKNGREISKISVPDGSTVVVEDSGKKGEFTSSEASRDDVAGRNGPVPAAGVAGSRPVIKPTVSSADALRPETSWRGTCTERFRSWTTNDVGRQRAIGLTIKSREGTRFKALAESFRGSHDAEGTFKDGAIDWKVASENTSWEGSLDGNGLVGKFKGANGQGEFSDEVRLTLADGPSPTVQPARLHPAGWSSTVPSGETSLRNPLADISPT
jgi:hypothetical protein